MLKVKVHTSSSQATGRRVRRGREWVMSIVEIYNSMGEKLLSQRIEQNSFQIDMSSFGDGIYFVRCMDNRNIFYMKSFNILK